MNVLFSYTKVHSKLTFTWSHSSFALGPLSCSRSGPLRSGFKISDLNSGHRWINYNPCTFCVFDWKPPTRSLPFDLIHTFTECDTLHCLLQNSHCLLFIELEIWDREMEYSSLDASALFAFLSGGHKLWYADARGGTSRLSLTRHDARQQFSVAVCGRRSVEWGRTENLNMTWKFRQFM